MNNVRLFQLFFCHFHAATVSLLVIAALSITEVLDIHMLFPCSFIYY